LKAEAEEREATARELQKVQSGALKVRNAFVADIGAVLNEARSVVKLKSTIRSLEDQLLSTVAVQNELEAVRQRLRVVEKSYHLTQAPKPSSASLKAMVFVALEDASVLEIFSYLQTEDVISIAQVSKYMFARVDDLFGIGSSLIQPHWREPYVPSRSLPAATLAAATATGAALVPPLGHSGQGAAVAPAEITGSPGSLTLSSLVLPDAPSGSLGGGGGAAAAAAAGSSVLLSAAMAEQLSKKLTGKRLILILRKQGITYFILCMHSITNRARATRYSVDVRPAQETERIDAEHDDAGRGPPRQS
jgi:hypothetical protein